jgi:LacI family transcriptional regulator
MALGAMVALAEEGLVVPDDIALVGFDDIPVARYVSPPLTSVHVPIAELGARAMERLLLALERGGQHARRHEVLPTTLVVRRSCGAGGAAATHNPSPRPETANKPATVRRGGR